MGFKLFAMINLSVLYSSNEFTNVGTSSCGHFICLITYLNHYNLIIN